MAALPLTTSCTRKEDIEDEETQDCVMISNAQYGSRAPTQSLEREREREESNFS